jgi:hypothetical protein
MAAQWLGEAGEAADPEFQAHLAACTECRGEMTALGGLWQRLADLPAPEPSAALDARWDSTMEAIVAALPAEKARTKRRAFWPLLPVWQAGVALACLVVGVLAGVGWRRDNSELARLREEVASTRAMVAIALLQQESATERLKGIDYSGQLSTMEPDVVAALIQAVDRDASVNVRLAAIDALSRAAGKTGVLQSLTASLPRQESPMVQAALVDYLVEAGDRQAVPMLRQLDAQPALNPAVRARTHRALQQLSE